MNWIIKYSTRKYIKVSMFRLFIFGLLWVSRKKIMYKKKVKKFHGITWFKMFIVNWWTKIRRFKPYLKWVNETCNLLTQCYPFFIKIARSIFNDSSMKEVKILLSITWFKIFLPYETTNKKAKKCSIWKQKVIFTLSCLLITPNFYHHDIFVSTITPFFLKFKVKEMC